MGKKIKYELGFSILILLFFLYIIGSSFLLKPEAAQIPRVFASVGIVLVIIKIRGLYQKLIYTQESDFEMVPVRNALKLFGWLVGVVVSIYLVGMLITGLIFTPVFAVVWGKVNGGIKPMGVFISTSAYILIIYVVFAYAMRFPLYKGLLNLI